jgi:hypothetical protein
VNQLPREARDGLMRAWLEILREKHPGIAWVLVDQKEPSDRGSTNITDPARTGSDGPAAEDAILTSAA